MPSRDVRHPWGLAVLTAVLSVLVVVLLGAMAEIGVASATSLSTPSSASASHGAPASPSASQPDRRRIAPSERQAVEGCVSTTIPSAHSATPSSTFRYEGIYRYDEAPRTLTRASGEFSYAYDGSSMGAVLRVVSPHAVVAAEGATSSSLSIGEKIAGQMGPRGWSESLIQETVDNPAATHSVWDFTSGTREAATAYARSDGSYVVVNDETGTVVQVSDINEVGWKPVWDDPRFQR